MNTQIVPHVEPPPDLVPILNEIEHVAKRTFLVYYSKCGVIGEACRLTPCSRTSVWNWENEDAVFASAKRVAYQNAIDSAETYAWNRALSGKSDTLLIFLMKGARPEKYNDRMVLQNAVAEYMASRADGLESAELAGATDAEIAQMREILGNVAARRIESGEDDRDSAAHRY